MSLASEFVRCYGRFFFFISMLFPLPAYAENIDGFGEIIPMHATSKLDGLKLVSLAAGRYPEYLGAKSYKSGVAPAFRLGFRGSTRYIQLLGPDLAINLLDNKKWSAGPAVHYRFGRGRDDGGPEVSRMKSIGDTVEVGAFIGWRSVDPAEIRNRVSAKVGVLGDAANTHNSYLISASAQWTRRVALPVDVFFSGAVSYAGDGYMNTYFGVDRDNVGASGLPLYKSSSGIRDARIASGVLLHFSKAWHFAIGGQYQRLAHNASESPIVNIHGNKSQKILGVAVLYAWQ